MEVVSCEMDHRLPGDLPTKYGTVAALSAQIAEHITLMTPAEEKSKDKDKTVKKAKAKKAVEGITQAKGKAKGKAKAKAKGAATAPKEEKDVDESKAILPADVETGGATMHFNRAAMMRITQQVGYFMCDQDALMDTVLNSGKGDTLGGTKS